MKLALLLAIPVFTLVLFGCGADQEYTVDAKVVAKWKSGSTTIVRVLTAKGIFGEFTNTYFGDMSPEVGQCVTVWVRIRESQEVYIFVDRNITPCQSSR